MGNKRRAVAVVLGGLLFAFMSIAGVLSTFLFNSFRIPQQANAEGEDPNFMGFYGTGTNDNNRYNQGCDNGVYYIEFAGQDGTHAWDNEYSSQYVKPGYGAVCFAFYKGSNIQDWFIGSGGGVSPHKCGGHGGGATGVYSNFALPSGQGEGYAYAAGGGGAGCNRNPGSNEGDAGASGGNAGWATGQDGFSVSHYCTSTGGKGATQSANGAGQSGNRGGYGGGGYFNGGKGEENDKKHGWSNEYHTYTYSGGGGGSSSPNCYPIYANDSTLGSLSTGNGYIKVYRIDPSVYPTGTSGNVDDGTLYIHAPASFGRYTPAGANSALSGYIAMDWVYRFNDDYGVSNWTTNIYDLGVSDARTRKVECNCVIYSAAVNTGSIDPSHSMKYTSATAAANDSGYVVASTTVEIKVLGAASVSADPTANKLFYNNTEQQLLLSGGSASNGTMSYRITAPENSATTWTSNFRELTAKNSGSYTIEYFAVGTGGYANEAKHHVMYVTIGKGDSESLLSIGTLRARPNLIFNNKRQQLFEGAAQSDVPEFLGGAIHYAVRKFTISGDEPMTDDDSVMGSDNTLVSTRLGYHASFESTDFISDHKEPNLYGEQIIYRLYYMMDSSEQYEGVGWKDTGVFNVINKATYTVSVDVNHAATYDGATHAIVSNAPIVKADSGLPITSNFIDVVYYLKYTAFNGEVIDYPTTNDPRTYKVMHAGQYELSSVHTINSDLKYQINPGIVTEFAIYQVKKTDFRHQAKLTGLTYEGNITGYRLDVNSNVYPFRDGEQLPVLTVYDVETYNGLLENNPNDYNRLGYLLTLESELPNENTINEVNGLPGFIPCSIENLSDTITNLVVHKAGVWTLWFNVIQHNSLADNVKIEAAKFTVYRFNDAEIELTGLFMTGAEVTGGDGVIVYDALKHPVVSSGTIDTIASQHALKLENVQFAISNSSNHTVRPDLTWVDSPFDASFDVKDVNYYYLWVRWGASENLQGTEGVIYAHLEIQQLVVDEEKNFHFGGVQISWDNPVHENGDEIGISRDIYAKPYNNNNQPIGSLTRQEDIRAYDFNHYTVDLFADLIGYGDLTFGMSSSSEIMDGIYYGWDEFNRVTVRNVGEYYLWIRWPGSANVSAGEKVYCIIPSDWKSENGISVDPRVTPCFRVEQLTNNETTELTYDVIDLKTTKEYYYRYDFVSTGTVANPTGHYVGVPQALFTTEVVPTITIGGYSYSEPSVKYQYMLTDQAEGITADSEAGKYNSGWVNSLDQAMLTDVADYYLWVLVTVEDENVSLNRTFQIHNGHASIIPTDSFVRIAPMPISNLIYKNQRLTVITASGQSAPEVEYALFEMVRSGNTYQENLIDVDDDTEAPEDTANGVYTEEVDGKTWKWTTDVNVNAMRPISAGLYKVYYRGKEYGDMFKTQGRPNGGYPYILVEIAEVDSTITEDGLPKAIYSVYTGKGIKPFEPGYAQTANYEPAEGDKAQVGDTGIPLLYSWDNEKWSTFEELDPIIQAGAYPLHFKADATKNEYFFLNPDTVKVMTMTVRIEKAAIAIDEPKTMQGANLIYKATDYHLFLDAVAYKMVDADGNVLIDENQVELINTNTTRSDWKHGGVMGTIYYAVSTSADVEPTAGDWMDRFDKVIVRQTGSYYVWMRVDEGDNHVAQGATCYNVGNPINIVAAERMGEDYENIRLSKSRYTAVVNGDGSFLRYTGLSYAMLKELNLQIELADRNDRGELVDASGNVITNPSQIVYNPMPATDRLARVYYALGSTPNDFPKDDDFSATGWQTSWQVLSRVDEGSYYLLIMISDEANSNIALLKFCLTTLETYNDDPVRDELHINPAVYDDIALSGISGITKMYTNGQQTIAVGNLTATITKSRYDVTKQIVDAKYYYVNVTRGDEIPTAETEGWVSFDEVKARLVGQYQLYVYLKVTHNIDSTSRDLIYKLFYNPKTSTQKYYAEESDKPYYAEITRVDENNLTVVAPGFAQDLIYNGKEQCLIAKAAKIEMKVPDETYGFDLFDGTGTTYYYISSSAFEMTSDKTLHGVKPADIANKEEKSKYTDYEAMIKEQHVGTYYIWIEFAEGTSHVAIKPMLIGSVTIAPATEQNIRLSEIRFTDGDYDGESHSLVAHKVKQTFINGNHDLNTIEDYGEIEYAYSNDPENSPSDNLWVTESNLADLMARDAGKYYIWVRVTGKPNTLNGAQNVIDYVKCYSFKEDDYSEIYRVSMSTSYIQGVIPHNGLSYIGKNQILASISEEDGLRIVILPNPTDKTQERNLNTAEYNKDLDIRWGLGSGDGSNRETHAVEAPTDWYSNITEVQAMLADQYYLWYYVPESKNFNETKVCFKIITIDKATIYFTAPQINTGDETLIYKGGYQQLLNTPANVEFHSTCDLCESEISYLTNGVTVEYRIAKFKGNATPWVSDYRLITGLHAGEYEIEYRVVEAANWYYAEEYLKVEIKPADASTLGVGLTEAPKALTNLAYNENEQDLIFFGRLVESLFEDGCGSALEGVQIVFNYAETPDRHYYYYYDQASGAYVWRNNNKLPGRVDAGVYHIQYYVDGSTTTSNYKRSEEIFDLDITIKKREVYWVNAPEPILDLKYTGRPQTALNPGQLNVGGTNPCTAKGVEIMYTADDQGSADRQWSERIPSITDVGFTYIWYYVKVDANNVFVGPDNSPSTGTRVVVLVERYILTVRDLPQAARLMYNAEDQNLISYAYLSTDGNTAFGNNAPFFEYSFSPKSSRWLRTITAKLIGTYTVYYRINYDPSIFEFKGENDGQSEPMQLTVTIEGRELETDSVRAYYDEKTQRVKYDATEKEFNETTGQWETVTKYNEETGEFEPVLNYSKLFLEELEASMQYWYRPFDEYNTNSNWDIWTNGVTKIAEIGNYQFMLTITGGESCFPYSQEGIEIPYNTHLATSDRGIEIEMPKNTFSTPAYIRAWIDFTGNMVYEDAKFKYEGWVENNGKLGIRFANVDSTGRNHKAVIRVQAINGNYYYITTDELSNPDNKTNISLNSTNVKNAIRAVNLGLVDSYVPVFVYEVYRIQYNANGGATADGVDKLEDGWKWHGIDYLLEENKFQKKESDTTLSPNGWNTSSVGNGDNYGSGALYYKANASQTFYAKYFAKGQNYFTVQWIITNGTKTYALSRDKGVWFDTGLKENQTRDSGILLAEGDMIVLPSLKADENGKSLSTIFGGHVLAWYTEDKKEYQIGMTIDGNITFKAELNRNVNNYVQCQFYDDQDNMIHDSGLVANGAKAYMALSGMDANTIKNYNDGYTKWVQEYGDIDLNRAQAVNGVLQYNFGTKRVIEEPIENDAKVSWGDYIAMVVILLLGAAATVASLTVYIIMRKKHHKVNLKNFKEETKGHLTI